MMHICINKMTSISYTVLFMCRLQSPLHRKVNIISFILQILKPRHTEIKLSVASQVTGRTRSETQFLSFILQPNPLAYVAIDEKGSNLISTSVELLQLTPTGNMTQSCSTQGTFLSTEECGQQPISVLAPRIQIERDRNWYLSSY